MKGHPKSVASYHTLQPHHLQHTGQASTEARPGSPLPPHRAPGKVLPAPAQDVRLASSGELAVVDLLSMLQLHADHVGASGVFPQILSGKPKMYQGVRVKITVKELLQQRRAQQAANGAAVSWGSSSIQFSESVSPPQPDPISSVPSYCPSWQFSNCLSCEESPSYLEQLVDSCLQTDVPLDPAFSAFQPSSLYTSDTFQPVPFCFNQGLAAGSPSSADLPSPLNYSCSPPPLSPITPLTHSPPSALDTKTYGYPAEEWSCHTPSPYTTSACCCTDCGSQHEDNRVPQYFPCPSVDCMDYLPPMAMADDFFRRDRNCDICYS
ncbi:POU class 2 homeobox associating factor 3 [Harpia harpyja]|uniref:POU class 2 homeobox associating factor 3 n=1 Tax=Harpia harpyja TaxID=202280 RepID=UPI0022B0D48B|nr:POU class 2 homeobox associating factor 3 [Harpia harpyja]